MQVLKLSILTFSLNQASTIIIPFYSIGNRNIGHHNHIAQILQIFATLIGCTAGATGTSGGTTLTSQTLRYILVVLDQCHWEGLYKDSWVEFTTFFNTFTIFFNTSTTSRETIGVGLIKMSQRDTKFLINISQSKNCISNN